MNGLVSSNQIASGFNWAHYSNPEIDAAIQKANATVDDAKRVAAYEAITTTLMKDAIFLPLWNVSGIYSGVKNLKDVKFGATGYSYYHVASFS
jgi:peptide/nickel transport system substrate-binding protein